MASTSKPKWSDILDRSAGDVAPETPPPATSTRDDAAKADLLQRIAEADKDSAKKPVNFRLPNRVTLLITEVVTDAARHNLKITREQAVSFAIEQTFGQFRRD